MPLFVTMALSVVVSLIIMQWARLSLTLLAVLF